MEQWYFTSDIYIEIYCFHCFHSLYDLKAADFQMLKNEKNKIKVNTGQVMLSGEIFYYWPLNSSEKVDKIVGETSFFFA